MLVAEVKRARVAVLIAMRDCSDEEYRVLRSVLDLVDGALAKLAPLAGHQAANS